MELLSGQSGYLILVIIVSMGGEVREREETVRESDV